MHVRSLNWGYKFTLGKKDIIYHNAYAKLKDKNTILLTNNKGE